MMRAGYSVCVSFFTLFAFGLAVAEDNIAACEIVIQQEVELPKEQIDKGADKETENSEADNMETEEQADTISSPMIATFIPATDFIFSVFDEEPGHLKEVEGKSIQALMCERRYLVPTEFDLRLIQTRIPLYLSQDFDSPDSGLMSVFFKDDQYQYVYSGEEISEDALAILEDRMQMLNAEQTED